MKLAPTGISPTIWQEEISCTSVSIGRTASLGLLRFYVLFHQAYGVSHVELFLMIEEERAERRDLPTMD
jgi:hypothetical protein